MLSSMTRMRPTIEENSACNAFRLWSIAASTSSALLCSSCNAESTAVNPCGPVTSCCNSATAVEHLRSQWSKSVAIFSNLSRCSLNAASSWFRAAADEAMLDWCDCEARAKSAHCCLMVLSSAVCRTTSSLITATRSSTRLTASTAALWSLLPLCSAVSNRLLTRWSCNSISPCTRVLASSRGRAVARKSWIWASNVFPCDAVSAIRSCDLPKVLRSSARVLVTRSTCS
mmetsp:Transcript_97169/g.222640  ORF Transcript_97169/g.222640 Transcript_97169/m.222640 type:complete len:229 (-) Transcript_97169:103-789(-)